MNLWKSLKLIQQRVPRRYNSRTTRSSQRYSLHSHRELIFRETLNIYSSHLSKRSWRQLKSSLVPKSTYKYPHSFLWTQLFFIEFWSLWGGSRHPVPIMQIRCRKNMLGFFIGIPNLSRALKISQETWVFQEINIVMIKRST